MTRNEIFSWLTEGPVDYELKQYKMMAVLSRLRKELLSHNIWPVIEEVETQLDYLYRTKYEIEVQDEKSKVAKDIDFINFEIIYEKEVSEQAFKNEVLDSVVDEAIVEFGDLYMDAREMWRDLESFIHLTWVPNKPPLLNEGYIAVPVDKEFKIYHFEKPTKISNSWRKLKLDYVDSFEESEDALLKFYDEYQNEKETLMFARISVKHMSIPHETAVIPIVKSILFNRLVKDFA